MSENRQGWFSGTGFCFRILTYSIVIGVLLLTCQSAWSAPVGQDMAGTIAQDWAYLNGWHLQEAGWTPTSADAEPQTEFAGELKDTEGEVVAYKYRFPTGGNVVVVNEDSLAPVFFYSETNTFDPDANPTARYLFDCMVAALKANRADSKIGINSTWTEISEKVDTYKAKGTSSQSLASSTQGPLIETAWNQYNGDQPSVPTYNYYCPVYQNEYCIVGCVATAMSQIMRYWQYPDQGQGNISYTTDSLQISVSVPDFSTPAFDWSNMPLSLTSRSSDSQIKAVAQLCFYCGAAVEMDYGRLSDGGSGAYSTDVRNALVNNFKYPSQAEYITQYSISRDMSTVMQEQISLSQPVYCSGGGHAFILDGSKDSSEGTLFHFNLGWGGSANGWYTMSDVAGYYVYAAVINIGGGKKLTINTTPTDAGIVLTNPTNSSFTKNSTVRMKTVAFSGYVFDHWAGDMTGTNATTTVTMDSDKTVTAVFTAGYKINSRVHGNGSLTASPSKNGYTAGETVTLQAVPDTGWKFDHWTGDATGSEPTVTLTMSRDRIVHAYFVQAFNALIVPTGEGSITRSQEGPAYKPGSQLTLTAVPAQGWVFRKWWGDVNSTDNPVTITMNSEKVIQAEFVNPNAENVSLTITNVGNGRTLPFGGMFTKNSSTTLTATPDDGWKFVQWRGDIVSNSNPLTVTMDSDKSLTVVFARQDASMPADEKVQSDETQKVSETTSTSSDEPAKEEAAEDSEFRFSNLIDSCSPLSTVLLVMIMGGFMMIRVKD